MLPYPGGVHAYPIVLVTAVGVAASLVLRECRRRHDPLLRTVLTLSALATAALLGAKLWRLGEMDYVIAPRQQLVALEGFRAPGGYLGLCIGALALVPIVGF